MYRNCSGRQNDVNQYFSGDGDFNMNIDVNMPSNNMQAMNNMPASQPMMGGVTQPIIEPMQERIVNRTIMHEVPHVCPIRTKIINNHVYRHTYSPSYSCCEENTCTNLQCGSCCQYK